MPLSSTGTAVAPPHAQLCQQQDRVITRSLPSTSQAAWHSDHSTALVSEQVRAEGMHYLAMLSVQDSSASLGRLHTEITKTPPEVLELTE